MDNSSNDKFTFRLPKNLRDRFNLACKNSGVSSSSVLRMLMTNYVETNIPQNKSFKKESFKLNKISEKKNEKKNKHR